MNTDTTCCTDETCTETTKQTTDRVTPNDRIAEPEWQANRHQDGVDLTVSLPGVKKEDLKIEARERDLLLDATRRRAEGQGTQVYGTPAPDRYQLKLRLAANLDPGALKATLRDGVLTLAIPLAESAKPRQIQIH